MDAVPAALPNRRAAARLAGIFLFTLAVLLLPRSPAAAQGLGAVEGRVVDDAGGALAGVSVAVVVHPEGGRPVQRNATADNDGRFRVDGLPDGRAELTFRLINFTVVRRTETIASSRVATLVATMRLTLSADVVVTAPATFRHIADVGTPTESLVGIAGAASQGAVTAAQLRARPIMRVGEVLEAVPGLIVSQHSGEGKANQYYLRGFNLDHGTDFATTVAGVPVNMPTGAHAHGYSDANFVIPELVSGIQFKKGPYFADEGDFSAAGAANVNYTNSLSGPLAIVSGGGLGFGRVLGAASPRVGSGILLAGVEITHNNGPWVRNDAFRKTNGVLRYTHGDTRNGMSITGMGYWADWSSTDQIPARAVADGRIPRFGFVDPSDRGTTSRQSVALDLHRSAADASTRATAFVLRNRLDLFSNFTYFLDDPEQGDQFEQSERRVAVGGRLHHERLGHLAGRAAQSAIGVQVRHDRLDPVGLYHTASRSRLSTTREDDVAQTMSGIYASSEMEWTRRLRTTAGLRADVYRFAVTANDPRNSGDGVAMLVSPKLSAAFALANDTELYANGGFGYHSNDARGALTRFDPASGAAVDPVTPLVRARGAELGLRTVRLPGVQSTVALWYLGMDSELLFVGDAGTTTAGRPSARAGIEWTTYARITPWLTAEADVAFSRARFTGAASGGSFIAGALARVIAGGAAVEHGRIAGSLRVRHFGPRPLIEDGSLRSPASTIVNGEAGYRLTPQAQIVVDAFNVLDARASDIDYFYTSRLPGEPPDGVADVHTHPALPRSLRVTLRIGM